MREIKFRAWDYSNSLMVESEDWVGTDEGFMWGGLQAIKRLYYHSFETKEIEYIKYPVIMQYTGLEDKNGKEIYEGDVVYLEGYGNYEVKFPFIELYQAVVERDIKGNIYENPELRERVL